MSRPALLIATAGLVILYVLGYRDAQADALSIVAVWLYGIFGVFVFFTADAAIRDGLGFWRRHRERR